VRCVAAIFDTDGVVTRTASIHFEAWKAVFDRLLADHASGDAARAFTDADYRTYVDGVGRYDGVEKFLRSRGIDLPRGDPSDPPGDATACAVGNLKNESFALAVANHGVEPYLTTLSFIGSLHEAGIRTAVVSASKNMHAVLAAAGVEGLFEVAVDGNDLAALGLSSKPAPDLFLEAARRLGVDPSSTAVIEDAVSGVRAGRAGGFALVVGIDRSRHRDPLAEFADLVVPDAADLGVIEGEIVRVTPRAAVSDLADALTDADLARQLDRGSIGVFLDYDGTLTPIVARPEQALPPPGLREILERLGRLATVAIVSGRDLDDVRSMVGASGIWYAGSHGFDLMAPDGRRREIDVGATALPALRSAGSELERRLGAFAGAWIEHKRFAVAVHFRAVDPGLESDIARVVAEVAAGQDDLRVTGGKKILELRPAADWDKGKAVRWVSGAVGLDPDTTIEVFLGDDVTDEDAFTELRDRGIGIVVGDDDRPTAAHFRLADTAAVLDLLVRIADGIEGARRVTGAQTPPRLDADGTPTR